MAHHGESPLSNFPDDFDDFRKSMSEPQARRINELLAGKFKALKEQGPTGRFPDGKLNQSDEGEIRIGIADVDGRVVMNFGKPIEWIGFTKEQAKQIALSLQDKAGFSMWNWMKGWLDAWEKDNPDKGVSAHSIISWMNEQPTTA